MFVIDVMAKAVIDVKPVIATVSGAHANPEGEMDALLLGRTRVSFSFSFETNYFD